MDLEHDMEFTRRHVLAIGSGTLASASLIGAPSLADPVEDAIRAITGGSEPGRDRITITAPEIAENGHNVPVDLSAPGAVAITLLADGNPEPGVAHFRFGPLSGAQSASTRVRLAQTQNVIAIAEMADGSYQMAQTHVKVTIGGCGG